jgi:hypothetical protein
MLEDVYALDARWQLGETLAIRGERFCLFELSVDYSDERHHVDYLTVNEIDEQDRARRVARFEPDAMAEAHDELHRWWIESLDPGQQHVARVAARLRHAVEDADADAIEAAVADDFVLEDRRTPGFGRQTRQEFITSQSGDAPMVFSPQVHLITGRVIVVCLVMAFDAPSPTAGPDEGEGGQARPPTWELANPTVSVVEHDRVVRCTRSGRRSLGRSCTPSA